MICDLPVGTGFELDAESGTYCDGKCLISVIVSLAQWASKLTWFIELRIQL